MRGKQRGLTACTAVFLALLPLLFPMRCAAQHVGEGGVETAFTVTNNLGQRTVLTAGIDRQATSGIDMQLGERELPPLPPSEIFDVRFTSPTGTQYLGEGSLIDFRQWKAGVMTWIETHQVSYQAGRTAANAVVRAPSSYPAAIRRVSIDGRPLKAGDSVVTQFATGIVTMEIAYDVTPPDLRVSPAELTFVIPSRSTTVPDAQTVQVVTSDTALSWQVSVDAPWVSVDRGTGRGSGTLVLGIRWLAFPEGRSSTRVRVYANPQTDTAGVTVNVDRLTAVAPLPSVPGTGIADVFPQPARLDDGNGTMSFTIRLKSSGMIALRVYDAFGRLIRTLCDGAVFDAGAHSAAWNLRDAAARAVPPGVYLCVMEAAEGRFVQPVVVQ